MILKPTHGVMLVRNREQVYGAFVERLIGQVRFALQQPAAAILR
jgi:hypothetical protein